MQQIQARIRLLILYLVISLPVIVYGAVRALEASNNSPIDWVDERFAERQVYDHFSEQFGPGDAVVISWSECWWTDPRLDEAVRRLRTDSEFQDGEGNSYFHAVACGRETLLALTGRKTENSGTSAEGNAAGSKLPHDPAGAVNVADDSYLFSPAAMQMTEAQAVQRLQGLLIGKDGRLTTVVVTLNSAGLALRAKLVPRICEVVAEVCGTQVAELKLAGPVIDGLTVDESSHRSLTKFALPSTIVIFVICLLSLKSVTAALVVFLTACFCQGLILAVIYYSGERLSALLIILPPLVQVLAVSGGIHLMNYYLNALRTMEPRQAAVECFRRGWLPSMLSLGTTAMGTASLLVSGLLPIRLFGIYGTVGVLCTAAAVLTAIPCSMMLLGRKRPSTDAETAGAPQHGQTSGAWSALTALLCNYNVVSLLILFGLMALAAVGLPDLKTSVRIETLYEPNSRIMQDYEWLEDRIGALVPIEVLLHFSPDCTLSDRQRMDVLWKVDRALRQQPTVKAVMSALTLFPDPPRMPGLPRSIQASLVNKGIRMARPQFEQAAVLRTTAEGDIWRLTARVSALAPLDYGDVLKQMEQALQEPLEQVPVQSRHQISLSTSGIMPLVHQIQGQLLSDLFNSLMSALAVITLTMTLVQAGILNGILAMASNVFPIVIAFGLMGLLAVPMDIGSVMTASIALGIAVDDTLHFLTFFRRELQQPGATRRSAVLATYLDCGPAMIQTSVSCGIGLLVFAFSDFVPTSRFAVLMAFLLALALAGDLLLLPALLLSPAGRLYETEPPKHA